MINVAHMLMLLLLHLLEAAKLLWIELMIIKVRWSGLLLLNSMMVTFLILMLSESIVLNVIRSDSLS